MSRDTLLSTEATLGRCEAQGSGWGGGWGPFIGLVVYYCALVDMYRRVKARLKVGEVLPQHEAQSPVEGTC